MIRILSVISGQIRHKCILASIAWFCILVVAVAVYWPGLAGPFLFDDYGSLGKLGDLGGVRDWNSFLVFVFGGTTGPTGRPISLLTFLLDGTSWPTDSYPFKRTNLILHLLNGSLVAVLSAQVLSTLKYPQPLSARGYQIAIISAAIWLLHPFLVSTTLYIVQRMAQLSALFCFAGLSGYLYGRRLLSYKPLLGYLWMSTSLALGTFLATFSKENGAILPVLAWVAETTLAAANPKIGMPGKWWKRIFLVLPSLIIWTYLIKLGMSANFFGQIEVRGYSIYERLLTEARILFDYLRHWFVPELFTPGVFHDRYPKSTGLLSPWTTLTAIVAHAIIIAAAFVQRQRWPLASFAVLFFYAAHLIESSTVALELYFEHRNYLAAAFLYLPVCVLLSEKLSPWISGSATLVVIGVLAGFTAYSAQIWSNYPSMALAWAQKAPSSSRAQQQASMVLFNSGRYAEALAVLDKATTELPHDLVLRVWKITVNCKLNGVEDTDTDAANQLARETLYDLRAIELYRLYVDTIGQKSCANLSIDDGFQLFEAMLSFPGNADEHSAPYSQIQYLIGNLAVYGRQPATALERYRRSLGARPAPDHAMNMASFLATQGYFEQALTLADDALSYVEQGNAGTSGQNADILKSDIRHFQNQVKSDLFNSIQHDERN